MCKRDGETIYHLLFHCPVARELWHMVLSLFEVHRVMPSSFKELLASWMGKFSRHKFSVIWSMIPYCIMWSLWQERNAQTFEGSKRLFQDLKFSLLQALFKWKNALEVFSFSSLPELLDSCTFHAS